MLSIFDRCNFLLSITPESYCALVYECLLSGDLDQAQWAQLYNVVFANRACAGSDQPHIYTLDEFAECMMCTPPLEIIDMVADDFRTSHKFCAMNYRSGEYNSSDYPDELVSDISLRDWKQALHELADNNRNGIPFDDFRQLTASMSDTIYAKALRIMLGDYADAADLPWQDQVKDMDELAKGLSLFILEF